MTPSLLQKIELLTLSRLELSEMLQTELTENPVLEESQQSAEVEAPERAQSETAGEEKSDRPDDDFDYDYFFGDYLNSTPQPREREFDDDRPSFDLFLASPSSLTDHLNWQLNLSNLSEELAEIAYFITGNINEDGYLTMSVEEIAEEMDVEPEAVEEAIRIVQSLDPAGIAAKDLADCLMLQLDSLEGDHELAKTIILAHLELVQAKKHKEIARALGTGVEEIEGALEVLRRLSPKPGQKYSSGSPQYIQPDVYISKVNGEYQINMNDDGMPKLSLNRAYRQMLKDAGTSRETKTFIKEKVRSALELLKSVDQRQQTIYRVCSAIVNRQQEFLDRGLLDLKPMLIKDIAEELGVHSSTISRVVANKYAHTPQGVIELRKFFTVGIESAEGENVSIVQVKDRIRKIIDNESHQRPYSDQQITEMLNREGIQITRRTVAKYRDQMSVPGSRERKRAG